MPNVLLTNYCNRNCPYCFAQEKVRISGQEASTRPASMSLEDLEYVVDFLVRSDVREFAAIGGEPTLHPQFVDAMGIIERGGFESIKVFTNGIVPEKNLQILEAMPDGKLKVLVNVNHPAEENPKDFARIRETLCRLGQKAVIGFNIYRKDCDLSFLPALTMECGLVPRIRLGIAQPIAGMKNTWLSESDYRAVGLKIVALSEECDRHDISVGFDCGFPFCMFTPEELGLLVERNCDLHFRCSTIVDIGPDLSVWPCFSLSTAFNVPLRQFGNLREILDFYAERLDKFRHVGSMDACPDCKYKRRGQCAGGCLSRMIRSFGLESVVCGIAEPQSHATERTGMQNHPDLNPGTNPSRSCVS